MLAYENAKTIFNKWLDIFDAGLTAVQSMISFGLGAAMSSSGMWKSLNKGEFSKSYSSFRTQGNNFAKVSLKPLVLL